MFESIPEAIFYFAEKSPDALFAADNKMAFTYKQAKNAILNAVKKFIDIGIKPDNKVIVECTQNTAYLICQHAIALVGGVFVPVDRHISADRLNDIIEETDAVCYAGTKPFNDSLLFFAIDSIKPEEEEVFFEYKMPGKEQRSELLYSTGTTGKAKGIDLTHGNNVALAENIASGVSMEPGNVEIIPVSLFHSHGLRTTYANFLNGNAVVLASGVTFMKPFFALMEKYGVNAMDLVPSAMRILCQNGAKQLKSMQDRIRYVELGSAPLTDDDKHTLQALLPKSRLYNFYGSTESGRTCTFDFASYPDKSGCIGKPVKNAEVLIVDDNHKLMENNSAENTGYLAFRGKMNMTGYWKNPELTDSIMQDGVFFTKDIGYIDADGWIYMLGRDDDIINYGGVKINPSDIEEAVMHYEDVADCGCVGVDDPVSGQVPWLFIVLDPASDITVEEIGARLMKDLEREKMPKRIIPIEQIPRTFNGKLLRKELKEIVKKTA